MRKLVWASFAVIGILSMLSYALFGVFKIHKMLSDDEAPIRVRNGSLEFEAGNQLNPPRRWKWEEKGPDNREQTPSYSHEPEHLDIDTDEEMWVKVIPSDKSDASCRSGEYVFSGDRVILEYQEANSKFIARLRRGKRAVLGVNYRTKVRPKDNYALEGKFLRYKGVGYIAEVSAGDGKCTFTKAADLLVIAVCSSEKQCRDYVYKP